MTSFLLLIALTLGDSPIRERAPESPTSPTQTLKVKDENETDQSLRQITSSQMNDFGGALKSKTINLRGSESAEVGVDLEGVRLNSPSRGTANFGEIDLYGLEEIQVIRGGQSFLQASPGGQIRFQLSSEDRLSTRLELGSFRQWMVGQITPSGSFSFRHTDGNFRKNNQSSLVTTRLWKRESTYQLWGQFVFSDQSLAGSKTYLTPNDSLQSITQLAVFQRRWNRWDFQVWSQLQNQEVFSSNVTSQNWNHFSGARAETRFQLFADSSWLHRLEWNFDYLNNNSLSESSRWTFAYASSFLFNLKPGQILQPRLRVEYMTDLSDATSVHPGVGGKHQILEQLNFLWNASWISRAPTFFELYFKDPYFLSNPKLKRQKTFSGDAGLNWQGADFNFSETFFISKAYDLIETVVESQTLSTVKNRGRSLTWGFETEARAQVFKNRIQISSQYTYQQARRGNQDRVYQPRHRLQADPEIQVVKNIKLSTPLSFRSKMLAPAFYLDRHLNWQFDLGLKIKYTVSWGRLDFQAFNLLGWNREEIKDYPLPQKPWFKIGLQRNW